MEEGIVVAEKIGKTMYYRRGEEVEVCNSAVVDFFSEVAPCSVIGSYILDVMKPVYNFKASDDDVPWKKK